MHSKAQVALRIFAVLALWGDLMASCGATQHTPQAGFMICIHMLLINILSKLDGLTKA